MNDHAMELLIDLHTNHLRQGPGTRAATQRALDLAGLRRDPALRIADIGCGTGTVALELARVLGATVEAVDMLPEFLEVLTARAAAAGYAERIRCHAVSMDALPFEEESLDAIWSEGAIYNIGFERGITLWRRYLRPGGVLALSEITWLTATRPGELEEHWNAEYPEIACASQKIAQLERAGYTLLGYLPLTPEAWLDHYYEPLEQDFDAFLARHPNDGEARELVAAERREIALYRRYSDYVSYGFYVARRFDES